MSDNIGTRSMLLVVLLAVFVVPSSISGTAIVLPAIAASSIAELTELHWVVNAFNLTFACFTLLWGALADAFGRKRAFVSGAAIYAIASLLSALAPNPFFLDLARALAGIGGAAIFSCGSAMLAANFEGASRTKAFALFGTVAGLGISLGPTISGLLVDFSGWQSIFYIHAILLFIVVIGSIFIKEEFVKQVSLKFDVLGGIIFIVSLFLFMLAIVEASQNGWINTYILSLIGLGFVSLIAFVLRETSYKNPMLDLSLLKNRKFVGLVLIPVAASFCFVTLLTYLPTYLTSTENISATEAGMIMIWLTVPVLICPLLAGKMVTSGIPANRILLASLACLVLGNLSILYVAEPGVSTIMLSVPLLITGAGMGLSAGLVDGMAMNVVEEKKAGMAAGVLNTLRLGSEAVAVALYGSLIVTFLDRILGKELRESFGEKSQAVINDVAAGNFSSALSVFPREAHASMNQMMIQGYNASFQSIVWVLAIIGMILMLVISYLIRDDKKTPIMIGAEST